jgi:hypothetical protein
MSGRAEQSEIIKEQNTQKFGGCDLPDFLNFISP